MQAMALILSTLVAHEPLAPGDHVRSVRVDGRERSYLVHVPPRHDPRHPTPVVLAFHGAAMNGPMMASFCGLNKKADEAGFVAVYPNGTGRFDLLLVWNAGGFRAAKSGAWPDDVKFVAHLLDDLATVVKIDPKRVYATGLSNGAMMCYRLAAELSDRIAAIAPVAGTMAVDNPKPRRPVAVMHFHGTADRLVPVEGLKNDGSGLLTAKSVEESVVTWARLDGCPQESVVVDVPDKADDGTTVKRKTYGPGREGTEVVLFVVEGGGHTWPGRYSLFGFLGKSTRDISANDLIWEFFQKHPMK